MNSNWIKCSFIAFLCCCCFSSADFQQCKIVTDHKMNNNLWTDYFITATGNHSIAPICRCSSGMPFWEYSTASNSFEELTNTQLKCLNEGEECGYTYIPDNLASQSLFLDATLTNFVATETITLYCRNTNYNYAPAIAIVITQVDSTSSVISSSPSPSPSSTINQPITVSPSTIEIVQSPPLVITTCISSNTVPQSSTQPITTTTTTTATTTTTTTIATTIATTTATTTTATTTATVYRTATVQSCTTETTMRGPTNAAASVEAKLDDYKMVSYVLAAIVCITIIIIVILTVLLLINTIKKKNTIQDATYIDNNKEAIKESDERMNH